MPLLAFLPVRSFALLRILLPTEEIDTARDWADVHTLAATSRFTALVIDPSADGSENIDAAVQVVRTITLPVYAYVPPTPANLRAVFVLSRNGLTDAFCCSEFNPSHCWPATISRTAHNSLSQSFLKLIEARLGRLPYPLARTISDVFENPHLYDQVDDLARKAGLRGRSLYRALQGAGLSTPKKLLAIAKVLRGVTYLQSASVSVTAVSGKISYSRPRMFCHAVEQVFRCSPSALRGREDSGDMLVNVVEWLYKPQRSSRGKRTHSKTAPSLSADASGLDKTPGAVADGDEYRSSINHRC